MLDGLSIIIPCYNEEGSLETVVRDVCGHAARCARTWEVIIVNDGSADRSGAIGDRLAAERSGVRIVHHPKNGGFGAAFRTGIGEARYGHLMLVPADNQFPAADMERFLPQADADIVVGYRVNRPDPVRRRVTTLIFFFIMFFVFRVALRDINWIKLYRRRVFEVARPSFGGIGIDAEIIVRARRAGLRFGQVRVGYLERTTGKSTGDDPRRVRQTILELLRLGRGAA